MKTVLSWLVLAQAYLAASSPLLSRNSQESQIESLIRTRSPVPFRDPSPNTITPHTVRLNRISTRSPRVFSRSGRSSSSIFQKFGSGLLAPVLQNSELAGDVTIGNQTFKLIFDTGSSDLWVAGEDFRCVTSNFTVQSNTVCNFTTTFKGTYSGGETADRHLNVSYGSGQSILGTLGYDSVSVAGITIPDQEFSIASRINFQAQGEISGLVGLAYPQLTSAFAGNETRFAQDRLNATLPYDNIFTDIFKRNLTAPLFSIAMERGNGGILAIGGLPSVPIKPSFASTPILIADILNTGILRDRTNFTFYTIVAENYVIGDSTKASSLSRDVQESKRGDEKKIPGAGGFVIVDSGTTLTQLPQSVTKVLYEKFSETPVPLPGSQGPFLIPCNTTIPEFGIEISDQTFYMSPEDIVLQGDRDGDLCLLGVQPSSANSPSILGGTWLHNVLAVFDVGASQMRFAPRLPY
ncbi:hypothetical protein ACHAQJ_000323 [Trichoderma viride]